MVGRNGEVIVQLRGDGTGPHTMENSFKKAFTARTFRIPSGEMEKRLKKNPQMGAQYLTGFTTARGALPIKIGDDVIGAAGVSGAPGGEKDEACVKPASTRSPTSSSNRRGRDRHACTTGNVMTRLSRGRIARVLLGLAARAAGVAVPMVWAFAVNAQTYPDRPIRVIVPIAAGSVTDVIMRATASELAPRLGQSFVIENKGGASGIPGAQACAQAAPDGYTLCLVYHNTLSINPLMFNKLPYDADKDFTLITNLYLLVEALFVNSALNVGTAAELKAYAQAHPRALNYGTLGPGSNPEMFLKWMNQKWNVNIVGIPYRGGGPIAQALVANELQVAKMGLGNFLGLMGTGKIKPLAVAAARRSPLAPDVPTLAEAGIDFPPFGWWGLAAPKGLPQPIVDRLNAEFVKLYREPKFVDYLEKQAVLPAPGTPAEFAAFLKKDRQDAELLIGIANQPREDYKAQQ